MENYEILSSSFVQFKVMRVLEIDLEMHNLFVALLSESECWFKFKGVRNGDTTNLQFSPRKLRGG